MDIIDAENERRIGSTILDVPEDMFDLFTVQKANGEVHRLAVYDSSANGSYYVKPYHEAVGQ